MNFYQKYTIYLLQFENICLFPSGICLLGNKQTSKLQQINVYISSKIHDNVCLIHFNQLYSQ